MWAYISLWNITHYIKQAYLLRPSGLFIFITLNLVIRLILIIFNYFSMLRFNNYCLLLLLLHLLRYASRFSLDITFSASYIVPTSNGGIKNQIFMVFRRDHHDDQVLRLLKKSGNRWLWNMMKRKAGRIINNMQLWEMPSSAPLCSNNTNCQEAWAEILPSTDVTPHHFTTLLLVRGTITENLHFIWFLYSFFSFR
jgi:hypothetical protein